MPVYCVTGGTGFIAAYLVKSLLLKGHNVRTTVRDPGNMEKVGFLLEMDGAKERLEIVKADLMVKGSFDEAMDGVDGVFHAASPVLVPHDENIEVNLVRPCVSGTLNVLNSCIKAKTVKRVVLTSSCSAIRYREDAQEVSPLNETHWSDPDYCRQNNVVLIVHLYYVTCFGWKDKPTCNLTKEMVQLWYAFAKTSAEQEAWNVAKESGLDLVVVNPSFVVGPLLTPQPTSTLLIILGLIKGEIGKYPNQSIGFVHIEDVVAAHILAMEESRASGCRLICSSAVAHWAEIIDMLRAKYPTYPYENERGDQKGEDIQHSMDCSKIMELGFTDFISIPQMFDDCIASFQEKGFLEYKLPKQLEGSPFSRERLLGVQTPKAT